MYMSKHLRDVSWRPASQATERRRVSGLQKKQNAQRRALDSLVGEYFLHENRRLSGRFSITVVPNCYTGSDKALKIDVTDAAAARWRLAGDTSGKGDHSMNPPIKWRQANQVTHTRARGRRCCLARSACDDGRGAHVRHLLNSRFLQP